MNSISHPQHSVFSPRCFRASLTRLSLALGLCLALAGCFNEAESTLDLGSVSVGQQLIDLKKARDSNAISKAEYEASKAVLLNLLHGVAGDDDLEIEIDIDDEKEQEEDDDSGFLF